MITVLVMSATVQPRLRSLTGFFKPLQDRADGDRARRALDGLVGVVPGVQVRKDEDGGGARDLALGQLGSGDTGVDGGIVLDGPLDLEIGPQLLGAARGLAHPFHIGAAAGLPGRVGEHGHAGLDPERPGRLAELMAMSASSSASGLGTTAQSRVDQHAVFQAHEEDAGDDRPAGLGADDLEGGADRLGGGVRGAGDHAIGPAGVDHHGSEVVHVQHRFAGGVERDAAALAQLLVDARELLVEAGLARIDDLQAFGIHPQLGDPSPDLALVAEKGQFDDLPALEDLGGAEDPLFASLRQDDVPAVCAGSLDQLVLEHQRRHPCRPRYRDAARQLRPVHGSPEGAQCRGDLSFVPRCDDGAHPFQAGDRHVGVVSTVRIGGAKA